MVTNHIILYSKLYFTIFKALRPVLPDSLTTEILDYIILLDLIRLVVVFMITNKILLIYKKSNSPAARFYRNVNITEV